MGFMTAIFGWTEVLRFRITFTTSGDVFVNVSPTAAVAPTPEFIRLWACYLAKTVHTLGGPTSVHAKLLQTWLHTILTSEPRDLFSGAPLFDLLQMSHLVRYAGSNANVSGVTFSGEYYAKGSSARMVQTQVPAGMTAGQALHSIIALMQHALAVVSKDKDDARLLLRTAVNACVLLAEGPDDDQSVLNIGNVAYMQALLQADDADEGTQHHAAPADTAGRRFCTQCGSARHDTTRFCPNCGNPLS